MSGFANANPETLVYKGADPTNGRYELAEGFYGRSEGALERMVIAVQSAYAAYFKKYPDQGNQRFIPEAAFLRSFLDSFLRREQLAVEMQETHYWQKQFAEFTVEIVTEEQKQRHAFSQALAERETTQAEELSAVLQKCYALASGKEIANEAAGM